MMPTTSEESTRLKIETLWLELLKSEAMYRHLLLKPYFILLASDGLKKVNDSVFEPNNISSEITHRNLYIISFCALLEYFLESCIRIIIEYTQDIYGHSKMSYSSPINDWLYKQIDDNYKELTKNHGIKQQNIHSLCKMIGVNVENHSKTVVF